VFYVIFFFLNPISSSFFNLFLSPVISSVAGSPKKYSFSAMKATHGSGEGVKNQGVVVEGIWKGF
jgi:hypothetical protein